MDIKKVFLEEVTFPVSQSFLQLPFSVKEKVVVYLWLCAKDRVIVDSMKKFLQFSLVAVAVAVVVVAIDGVEVLIKISSLP